MLTTPNVLDQRPKYELRDLRACFTLERVLAHLKAKGYRDDLTNPAKWAGNCSGVAMAIADMLPGLTHVRGHWLGYVSPHGYFAGRAGGVIQHGWLVARSHSTEAEWTIDPTRWVFEHTAPGIWLGGQHTHTECSDFEVADEDPDMCVCGDLRYEHRQGLFRPCLRCRWAYDEGGNEYRARTHPSRPMPGIGAVRLKFKREQVGARKVLKALGLSQWLTDAQAFWLAGTPYDELQGRAFEIYQALAEAGCLARIPIDNAQRAERLAGRKLRP